MQHLTYNHKSLCYEGVTSDGQTFVSVDAEEVTDQLEESPDEMLSPDEWADCAYDNWAVTLTDLWFPSISDKKWCV